MARDEGFSIISVNSEDSDEIVIRAGVSQSSPSAAVVEEEDGNSLEDFEVDEGISHEQLISDSGEAKVAEAQTKSNEGYQPTTREDLDETGPFQKTRLIIVGFGLLLIVGFVVYFSFLR